MEIVHTETNRGKKAIIVDGYIYRHANTLKNGDVVYGYIDIPGNATFKIYEIPEMICVQLDIETSY
jgi:hypothetical protein